MKKNKKFKANLVGFLFTMGTIMAFACLPLGINLIKESNVINAMIFVADLFLGLLFVHIGDSINTKYKLKVWGYGK